MVYIIQSRGELENTTCHPTTYTRMEENSKIDQSQYTLQESSTSLLLQNVNQFWSLLLSINPIKLKNKPC